LNPFLHKIKQPAVQKVISDMPLPDDLCAKIYAVTERQSADDVVRANREVYDKIEQLSSSIQLELEERMRVLHDKRENTFCVHSNDPYMNVINYFKALKGEPFLKKAADDDKLLLTDILPWLGLTDWGANTGGREVQLTTFKRKLKRFLTPNNGGIVTNPGKSQSQSQQLTTEQLREARLKFFSTKRAGKKVNTKKKRNLRRCKSMKKSKRT
jgi:hypothetical protein